MASDGNDKSNPDDKTVSYVVDSESTTEMPTITTLLNRKKLDISSSSGKQAGSDKSDNQKIKQEVTSITIETQDIQDVVFESNNAVEQSRPVSQSPNELTPPTDEQNVTLEMEAVQPKQEVAKPKAPKQEAKKTPELVAVKKTVDKKTDQHALELRNRKPEASTQIRVAIGFGNRRMPERLLKWQTSQLETATDPIAKGLKHLLTAGAKEALFLTISKETKDARLPSFRASAAFADRPKLVQWTGLKLDTSSFPEIWDSLKKTKHIILGPPGTKTNAESTRNLLRTVFVVESEDYLILFRTGAPAACRGVLAIIAASPMPDAVPEAIKLLGQAPPEKTTET